MDDLEITLVVLLLFLVVSFCNYALKYTVHFYLLKELFCKETQIGIECFNGKLTKHLVPEKKCKERTCNLFSFCKYKSITPRHSFC